ncbi:MAG: prolyl oligopeptidase family protein, partial [Parvularculaceae bacterium]
MLKTIAAAFIAVAGFLAASQSVAADDEDPYLWLEEIEGERALDWVRAQNARSLAELEGDPRFEILEQEALGILTSEARIPYGAIHAGHVYNFWQDETHVRGLWRRASVKSYRSGEPEWETLIDVDRLAEDEGENWVFGGVICLSPEYVHCMIEVSHGGKDASVWREFDVSRKTFVDDGFVVPEAKSGLSWVDEDTLLIGTDWGEGSLTSSGYARELRLWARGEALDDAKPYYIGETDDVVVGGRVEIEDDTTHIFVQRAVTFFETEYYYARAAGELRQIPVPLNADFQGVLDGRAIFLLREPWDYWGGTYKQGALVAFDLSDGGAELVFEAGASQSIEDVEIGESNIIVQYLENVSGKAARFSRTRKGEWKSKEIGLPENGVVAIVSAGGGTDDAMLSFESLTEPDSLYYVTTRNGVRKIAETPPFFDASNIVVEQRFAISKDGTGIPYFVMAREDVLAAGGAPTVQYGYGGFLIPILPLYYADPARPQHGGLAGKLWVARGGVLVLSNIRGGSEYGPAWHEAALRENRQRAYDDFIAISEDLIGTGVTSREKLGIIGRSNGGLLMGAMLTQRPDLYAAIDIGAPLFDMKRYNKLLAGASWMGEYGDPDKAEEWAYIS